MAGKTPKSPKSRVQVQNGPFDLFGPVCGKEVIRRIWSGRLRKAQKAVFRCRMAHSTWFAQFMPSKIISPHLASNTAKRPKAVFKCIMPTSTWIAQFVRINTPYLASKTPKRPKSRIQVQNGPLDLMFVKFVRNNYFALFGQKDSEQPKKPVSGAEWPARLDSPSLWKRIISPYLANKTPKILKSHVQVPTWLNSLSFWTNGTARFFPLRKQNRLNRIIWSGFSDASGPGSGFISRQQETWWLNFLSC